MFKIIFLILFNFIPLTNTLLPSDANPSLPIPSSHTIFTVSTIQELDNAILNIESQTTILIKPGTYRLVNTQNSRLVTSFGKDINDIAIRGESGKPEDVIIEGEGMTDNSVGHGIELGKTTNVLIAYLTIKNTFYHAIKTSTWTNDIHIYNCFLVDTGEQQIKISPNNNGGSNIALRGIIEFNKVWYTTDVPVHPELGICYTNGISAHWTDTLIVRHNWFENFLNRDKSMGHPAILIWNHAFDSIVESNMIINSDRGIYFGMESDDDHVGGIIKNNVFFRRSQNVNNPDVAIFTCSTGSKILHNTIWDDGLYYAPIEVRWKGNIEVQNNFLSHGVIQERDLGSISIDNGNVINSAQNWFKDIDNYNFELDNKTALLLVDKGDILTDCLVDFNNNKRPFGSKSDIGAFEHGYKTKNNYNDDDKSKGQTIAIVVGIISGVIIVLVFMIAIVVIIISLFSKSGNRSYSKK